jgi:4a-hydroxytetrahydrobiopterin dehydratase
VRPARATESEITTALAGLPRWQRTGDAIVATFEFAAFADAIAFVVRVGFAAEAADHHPDIDVRWRSVRIALSTHDAGGLSELDFAAARTIEGLT